MLMVIMGAGASYDLANPLAGDPLPLAEGIFEGRFLATVDQYPGMRPLIMHLRREIARNKTSFESELSKLEKESESDPVTARQMTALRFYLRTIISNTANNLMISNNGMTNYVMLMDILRRWQNKSKEEIRLVTFNYDTCLEEACKNQKMGWNFTSIDNYTEGVSGFKLFKPHGSTNWYRTVPNPGISREEDLIDYGDTIDLTYSSFVIEQDQAEVGTSRLPAIAVPIDRKTESSFECPSEQLKQLTLDLQEVDKIMVIGWRGAEPHFGDLMKNNIKNSRLSVTIVAKSDVDAVRQNLELYVKPTKVELHNAGFSPYISTGALEATLDNF